MKNSTVQIIADTTIPGVIDFRVKLFFAGVVIGLALLWDDPFWQFILAICVIIVCLLSGLGSRLIITVLLIAFPFFIVVVLVHGLFSANMIANLLHGRQLNPIFILSPSLPIIGGHPFSVEGIMYGLSAALRIFSLTLVLPGTLLSTSIDDLIASLSNSGLSHRVTFTISSAFRFFPLLLEETRNISDTQQLRGLSLKRIGWKNRLRTATGMVVPLILSSLLRAQQLEINMLGRGFANNPHRTALHQRNMRWWDYGLFIFIGVILFVAIWTYMNFGIGSFDHSPLL